ncbi:AraC family transcriptional regulator [Acinetobacter sp. ASP199]|uniref:AraC family transcriptional regulator n=1 Tax=unclassified Acinetobacter TaxID=196816 RepID=UPI001F61CD81|nr:AraC family transcriptional regulator [Acinetobacter sp. ASP199]UNT59443.1 AraC family transcriptional regulator [Acinetobacter sp. ASP199]
MHSIQDDAGTVYGGLGHLLLEFYQSKQLPIPEKLLSIQEVERFDFSLWRDLLIQLQQKLQTPALGLEIANFVQPRHLGIVAYLVLSCETLGEALMRYHDYHRLVYDGSPLEVRVENDVLSIAWAEIPFNLMTQLTDEVAMALMLKILRSLMAIDDIHLHEVHFKYPANKYINLYEQYFQCKVRFNQSQSIIFLHVSELAKPLRQGDQTLQKLLKQQAEALLEKLPNTSQADQRIQQAILAGLQKNMFQIEHIARQLHWSVRQLQRHLQKQGKTYQQRMQEIRFMLAQQYLKDENLSLHEISLLLGYSEQSAFQRAFKQWSSETPQQWRSNYLENKTQEKTLDHPIEENLNPQYQI